MPYDPVSGVYTPTKEAIALQQQLSQVNPNLVEAIKTGQSPSAVGQQVVEKLTAEGLNPAGAASSGRYTAQAVDYFQNQQAIVDAAKAAEDAAEANRLQAIKDAEARRIAEENLRKSLLAGPTIPSTVSSTGNISTTGAGTPTVTTPAAPTTITAANVDILAPERKSIMDILTARFAQFGLSSLVPKIKELAISGATENTITFALMETDEYKTRFKANEIRLAKNLKVLSPAEYITVEDSYRQVLRAYGLKQFDTDDYVSQFIANDVSPTELSNRVVTAVQRVQNADPAVSRTLRDYYGVGQADLVAYVLDPEQQFQKIQRQVSAAEIGTAARVQGLEAGVNVAEQLAAQGVTQAEAQKGYATIADILPSAKKLSDIYGTTLDGYDQSTAEQEVFNQLASAQRARKKLSEREVAAFSAKSGVSGTSLGSSTRGQI
jgi:hypothetical protein